VPWLVGAFVAFYLLSQPTHAAQAVKGLGGGVQHAATQLATFVGTVTK
jgi:hypothetical protein